MFVINLYANSSITTHEDDFNISNSPLISLCFCGATNFELNQYEYNRVYNHKSEIDLPEHWMLIHFTLFACKSITHKSKDAVICDLNSFQFV